MLILDFITLQCQAQQHAWVKEEYPLLFERIKEKVKEGRFIPTGGSWVEMVRLERKKYNGFAILKFLPPFPLDKI